MLKQPYTEIRLVQYPCIVGDIAIDRLGFFEVDFHHDDTPLRARALQFVGYDKPAQMVEFLEEMEQAVYERPTLININDPINPEKWGGTLYFPTEPILH